MSGWFPVRGRRTAALVVAIAAAAAPVAPAVAQSYSVSVDGSPLYLSPGPIERGGRVFVPLRGIFERLGAGVVYHTGTINATKGNTNVSLRIGSTQATINNQPQYLDVAPFIVGSTTYVPLRFVAQSLGAVVGYDGQSRNVSIDMRGESAPPPPRPMPPPPAPAPLPALYLSGQQPPPGASVQNRQPVVAAQFSQRVHAGTVRVTIDDVDVSNWTNRTQSGFSMTPRNPLQQGRHTVRVTGTDVHGRGFDRTWWFATTAPANSPVRLRNEQPAPGARVTNRRPQISANFTFPVNAGSVRVVIDVTDVTGWTQKSQTNFSMTPQNPLALGSHTVHVTGRDLNGSPFEREWSFTSIESGPAPVPGKPPLAVTAPLPNQGVTLAFAVKGTTVAHARIKVAIGAQAGGNGNFSGAGVAGAAGNFNVAATISPFAGQQTAIVTVTATNPATGHSTEKQVTVRLAQPR